MNTITLTIAATPDNLKRLAEAFGEIIDETLPGDAVPAKRYAADAKIPGGPDVRSTEIKDPTVPEPVAKEPENVAKEPETGEKAPENVADRKITESDLRSLGIRLTQGGHSKEVKALLKKYDAPKITKLREEQFAPFYAELEALAEEIRKNEEATA